MARVNVNMDEDLKNDLEVVASITGVTLGALYDKAALEYLAKQEPKIIDAVAAARRARA